LAKIGHVMFFQPMRKFTLEFSLYDWVGQTFLSQWSFQLFWAYPDCTDKRI